MKLQKNLLFYMLGRFISYIGTGIQQIAIPLYILDITHSAIMMGVFSALNLLPNVVTLPFAGILGDKKNRKIIMIVTDIGRGILILALGFLALLNSLNIYILFLIQISISIMDSIFSASSTAILPELIRDEDLVKAMSMRGGGDAISMIIGSSLGGIIYGLSGIKAVFFLNGLSFVMSAACSILIIYKNTNREISKITVKSFFTENHSVISFIKKNKALTQLFLFCLLCNFLVAPFFDIVFPYVLKNCVGFNSEQYGYLISCFTVGILVGNIVLGTYLSKFSTKIVIKLSLLLQGAVPFGPLIYGFILGKFAYQYVLLIVTIIFFIACFIFIIKAVADVYEPHMLNSQA